MLVPAGVAQGTVLGPLLFIFYINDIFSCLDHVNISMFADDCVLYLSGNNWEIIRTKIQKDLDTVVDWMSMNALTLNTSKTKTMIFGNRHKLLKIKNPTPLSINGKDLVFVKKYNYLGIVLDVELNLDPFFKSIIKKVNNKVYSLRKIRKYVSFEVAIQIYKQMILPFFDYGGFLAMSLSKEKRNELQKIQNDILRICNGTRVVDRVSTEILHNKAKLLSLNQRRQKQLLTLMYIYSKEDNVQLIPVRNTRNANKFVFKTETKIGTKYENSPFYKGTKLWNGLTQDIQSADDKWIFKTHVNKMYKKYKSEM